MLREERARQPLCADIDGFSLHAAVRVDAHDSKRLEGLCRDIARPALSEERVQLSAAGHVELKLKTPWRDGTTHLVMSPLEFMQRRAALVPRPRLHLISSVSAQLRCAKRAVSRGANHGVLAPSAKLRALVVPQGPPAQGRAATEAAAVPEGAVENQSELVQARPHRTSWLRLLERVFDIDMQQWIRSHHSEGGRARRGKFSQPETSPEPRRPSPTPRPRASTQDRSRGGDARRFGATPAESKSTLRT